MGLGDAVPNAIGGEFEVMSAWGKEQIIGEANFRDSGFPEGMDSVLMGELSIVVFGGVKGHVCIGHVVADVCRQSKDGGQVFLLKCLCEAV